jgi:monothiol glutaredoxin
MAIEKFIDSEVKANDVVLFMKGTPQFPMCGFSGQVVQILDHLGVSYKGLNVLENDELRNGIKVYSNWPTIPQLYVKGEFVGGCDIIREMFQAGELQNLLKDGRRPDQAKRVGRISRRRNPPLSGRDAKKVDYAALANSPYWT